MAKFPDLLRTAFLCLLLPALSSPTAHANRIDYFDARPRQFFQAADTDAFSIDSHQPLQRILSGDDSLYMTQDGDLYDEDVATLDYPQKLGAVSTDFSFRKSKYVLARTIYKQYNIAFYSGCRFHAKGKQLVPDLASCGYRPRKSAARANRIEWEHVVPAWVLGYQLKCWQEGGRAQCRNDKAFRQMEADLHNLVPAIGEINGDRSNFRYRMVEGETRVYGSKINMEIDFKGKVAEPPDTVYGDAARIHFYMRDRYGLALSDQQAKLLTAWNNLDPVSEWELLRNELIRQAQGNDNPYVSRYQRMEEGQSQPSVAELDAVDQFYLLLMANRDQLPYALVSLATLLYLGYLNYRRGKQAPEPAPTAPKTKKKASRRRKPAAK